MKKTIIDMTKAKILEGIIDNDLWSKLMLAMTYIKNSQPMQAFENISPHKAQFHKQLDLIHQQILSSIVCILLYKKKRLIKSEK